MSYKYGKMEGKRKIPVKDLNAMLTCTLCEGYLIDATVLADCLHVFCRGCIIKYFDNCRTACPNCNILYKKKNQICFRPDPQIQSLVYKLVPSLYAREMQTREEFYRSTGVRAGSSCSDDSVIDKERDNLNDQEAWVTPEFFSADDMISLSMEYYQAHLDTTGTKEDKDKDIVQQNDASDKESVAVKNSETNSSNTGICERSEQRAEEVEKDNKTNSETTNGNDSCEVGEDCRKRFLKCAAAVSMQLLQKFIRMKFGLTADHRVDIIHKGEVLPNYFTLMDVAYTFKWSRTKPMRFFYRIFTPMKIKPIKIINTTSTSGSKQLQIVQIDEPTKSEKREKTPEKKPEEEPKTVIEESKEETEDQSYHKERLMAHLQLQSTHKKNQHKSHEKKEPNKETSCVYEYVEPDKEEIKKFAEKRDREWALQKKLDEKISEHGEHHFSRKRKKSKHSKNDSVHKKRKLHAEITSNEEEDLKLKVKITPHNSHKHKHHKSYQNHSDKNFEASNKEKLLQMRQVRHKQVNSEDKTVQTISTNNINAAKQMIVDKMNEKLKLSKVKESDKKEEVDSKSVRFVETGTSTSVESTKEEVKTTTTTTQVPSKEIKKPIVLNLNKDVKSAVKEWASKTKPVPSVTIDRLEVDKQNTFIKTFQSYTEKCRIEKIKQNKIEARQKMNNVQKASNLIEKKMSAIQQQCTIEPKKTIASTSTVTEKSNEGKVLNQYPPGFTVSKIEAGVKRKVESESQFPDKRPSLEITLVPPTTQNRVVKSEKVVPKRPLPSTIPLDRIRTINLKSGISIIPKSPDVCDNIGALDLSNKSPESPPKPSHTVTKTVNGINMVLTNRNLTNLGQKTGGTAEKTPHQLSNLQMLSKVASEHPILNKLQVKTTRPNVPNMNGQSSTGATTVKPNLPKLQKLTEINKTQFKMSQVRSPRPNQNQNIRNIPNPSLLVRQQNQNRLNSLSANVEKEALSVIPSSVGAKVNNLVEKKEIPV